jgi:hypothetical protein
VNVTCKFEIYMTTWMFLKDYRSFSAFKTIRIRESIILPSRRNDLVKFYNETKTYTLYLVLVAIGCCSERIH